MLTMGQLPLECSLLLVMVAVAVMHNIHLLLLHLVLLGIYTTSHTVICKKILYTSNAIPIQVTNMYLTSNLKML